MTQQAKTNNFKQANSGKFLNNYILNVLRLSN